MRPADRAGGDGGRGRRPGVLGAFVLLLGPVLFGWSTAAAVGASTAADQTLAERYAPTVVMRHRAKPCDRSAEGLRPVPVDVVLDREDVVLRAPDGTVVVAAPTAADLAGKGPGYHLDLPGNALRPGCSYDRWFERIGAGVPTTAYAHVRTEPGEPGRLALQYWFYWIFNDWNDEHESDWEMIQLLFEADDAEEALGEEPVEVGYAQHQGAQRSDWDDRDLTKEQGTHPRAYAGAGSHSNHFHAALFLGHSGAEGFGCDNTTAPSRAERAEVILLPTVPGPGQESLAWLTYEGRWGERQHGPNDGPTGPNTKASWREPISWAEGQGREGAVTVPAHEMLSTSTTDFACRAMESLSALYVTYLRSPWLVLAGAVVLGGLAVWLSTRTRWSPAPVAPVDRPRRGGEILRSSARIYRRHPALFLRIGAVFVPLGLLFAGVQYLVLRFTGLGVLVDVASADAVVGLTTAVLAGGLGMTLATALVHAACASAAVGLAHGRSPQVRAAYRVVRVQLWSVLGISLRLSLVSVLLAGTLVGIPVAAVYLLRRAVALQACVVESLPAGPALRRSREVTRGRLLSVAVVSGALNLATTVVGPLVGFVVLLAWSPSLAFVNLISAVIYALAVPFAGIGFALLFYDLRRRPAGAADHHGTDPAMDGGDVESGRATAPAQPAEV